MNHSKYKFTLNTQCSVSQRSLPVKLGDTARSLYITLIDGGTPYALPDGCRAVFFATKPDGTYLMNDCVIELTKTVRYDFTAQTSNVPGKVECELRIYGSDGMLLTSPSFTLVVDDRVVYDDCILISESEATALDAIFLSEQQRVQAELERVEADRSRTDSCILSVGKAELAAEDVKALRRQLEESILKGTFNGRDGRDGRDGYTPIKGIDYFDGIDGKDGADGKDYVLSEADKKEIAQLLLSEFPMAEDVSI